MVLEIFFLYAASLQNESGPARHELSDNEKRRTQGIGEPRGMPSGITRNLLFATSINSFFVFSTYFYLSLGRG